MALSQASRSRGGKTIPAYTPPGVDQHTLEQQRIEQQNPGGAWVDGWYIPPGIDFNSPFFGGTGTTEAAPTPTPQVNGTATRGITNQAEVPNMAPTITSIGGPAYVAPTPQKTPDELRAEAAARAGAEIDSNANYLEGNAGLYNLLGQKLTGYDQQANFGRSDYQRANLALGESQKEATVGTQANLADRGINYGGVATDTENKLAQGYDVKRTNNTDQLQRMLSQIELSKSSANADYENSRLGLRRNVLDSLIEKYYQNSLAGIQAK